MRSANTAPVNSVGDVSTHAAKPIAHPDKHETNSESLDPTAAFAHKSEKARTLALEHGKLWEFLLIEELLKSKLPVLKRECDEFEKTLLSIPKRRFDGPMFTSWLNDEMNELISIVAKITKCITEELPASMGEPGVSGDAIKMLRAVDALFGYCRGFLDFELNLCAADPPSKLKVFKTVKPWASISASVQPSRQEASNSSARRRVAGGLRLLALRRGLPTEDIVRAYGIAMCESSRPKLPPGRVGVQRS
jgi:hypothetical protein